LTELERELPKSSLGGPAEVGLAQPGMGHGRYRGGQFKSAVKILESVVAVVRRPVATWENPKGLRFDSSALR